METIRLPRDEILNIRLEKSLKEKLEKAAKSSNLKVSQLVRYIIDSMICQHGVSILNGLGEESRRLDRELEGAMQEVAEKQSMLVKANALISEASEKFEKNKQLWIDLKSLDFSLESAIRYETSKQTKQVVVN